MSDFKIFLNGHNIYGESEGPRNGPTVVLLHHGLGSVRAWREQIPVLAEAGFRAVAYDRWGYGNSDTRPGLDVPAFSDDLLDLGGLFEHLNIQQAALLGHSDGGTIGLYFAAQQSERISCLVTVAAHVYVEPQMESGIMGVRQAFETDKRFIKSMQYTHSEKYQAVIQNWFDGWHRPELLFWDMRQVLGLIKCPALIVQGEKDEHATPQHAIDIAGSIPGAELWIIPGARHMLPQENAAEFNSRALHFLKEKVVDTKK